MRAMVFETAAGPDALKVADRPMPEPGHGEVLVRIGATSLNYRDLLISKGGYRKRQKQTDLVPLSDGAGTVEAVGPGVTGFKPSDRVTACFFLDWPAGTATEHAMESDTGRAVDGMLQEYRVIPVTGLVHTPANLTDAEAASLTCAGLTAWSAIVRLGRAEPGDAILTQGTGGVSLFALQFAKMNGCRVAITSSSDEKLDRAKALGADHGINYAATPEWGQPAHDWAGGDGVDNVVELGGTETMKQSLIAVRPGGTLSLIGVLSGATTGNVLLPFIISRDVRLQGVTVGPKDAMQQMCKAIEVAGMKPVIDKVFPFEDAADAYRHLASGQHFGKVCISVSGD
ncbi:MAG: NAD(P)-dependent alcohol dehydrogenase [Rhodospirillales bacterium]|nr:NAD(P)-dependent alcohol dehydrogenase [Rhodospirillales bacterium]MBO6787091.1 NAD(P)-dependent alcohol dehydrogenase [Rhodospirillales bacterium]